MFGHNEDVSLPAKQTCLFSRWIEEQGRACKLKTIYREFFGARLKSRMPTQNLAQLTKVLRSNGIEYDSGKTSANDFFPLRVDKSYVRKKDRANRNLEARIPEDLRSVLPRWVVSDKLPASSRDPLGLQTDAEKLANKVLPGLTVFTNRVGYFFFLAWAIQEINRLKNLSVTRRLDLLNRLERALVLCETLYHGTDIDMCYHQGQRSKRRLLNQATNQLHIPERILKRQYSTGCLPMYKTAMRSCAFWVEDHDLGAQGLLPYKLTEIGERLAKNFGGRGGADQLLRWAIGGETTRDRKTIRKWGESLCFKCFDDAASSRKWFRQGFLEPPGSFLDAVQQASVRLNTLEVLAGHRLFDRANGQNPTGGGTISVAQIVTGAEDALPDDELGEDQIKIDNSVNKDILLHFFSSREEKNAASFVRAAVYELAALALNAIWKGLLDEVAAKKRIRIRDWVAGQDPRSSHTDFWKSTPSKVLFSRHGKAQDLVERIQSNDESVRNALELLVTVWNTAGNADLLKDLEIYNLVSKNSMINESGTMEDLLAKLIVVLLERHATVSRRKGKSQWVEVDGEAVRIVDDRQVGIGFHSFRFPQLQSLLHDLNSKPEELLHA